MKLRKLINMKKYRAFMMFVIITCALRFSAAQTTEFTYQGRLLDNNLPLTATYDFQFSLWDTLSNGSQVGDLQTISNVQITNGIFTVKLDFGDHFTGANRFLQIEVRNSGGSAYTTLAPRQSITSAPQAIRSLSSTSADGLSIACVSCVTNNHIQSIDGTKVTGTVANATNANNATNVTGVVAVANGGTGSSTKSFVDLSTDQSAAGNKTFTGSVNVTGASGVFNGNGSGLTNLNGGNIASGTITTQQLSLDAANSSLKLLALRRWDLLKVHANFTTGNGPTDIAFDGANVWVANFGSNTVTKLKASTGENLGSFPVGAFPRGIMFDGSNIWIASDGSITKLRASDGVNLGSFALSGLLRGIVFDGTNIWVANASGGNLTKINSTGAVLGNYAVGGQPAAVVFDGMNIWVTNLTGNNVTKLRASDGANLGSFSIGLEVSIRGVIFDGTNIWVAGYSNSVTRLRASDGACIAPCTFTTGVGGGDSLAFDGENVWVTSSDNGKVTKLRASDGVVLGSFPVGTLPRGIVFDGTNIWVANQGGTTVTRLQPAFIQP